MEHHCTQKRDGCRNRAVVERRKKRGCENIEAREQKRTCEQPERMAREGKKRCIVAHKQPCERIGKRVGQHRQQQAGSTHQQRAFLQQIAQLAAVARAVMIPHHRGAADGIADVDRNKNKLHIQQYAVGRNPVLSHIPQQLKVVDDAHDGGRNIAHQLGGAVAAGTQQRFSLQPRFHKPQQAAVRPQKIEKRQQPAHTLAQPCGKRGTCRAPTQDAHKQCVQRHIGKPRRYRNGKAELRLFGRDEKALKHILQHEEGVKKNRDAAVTHTIGHHLRRRAQKHRHGAHKDHTAERKHRAKDQRKPDHHGKAAVRLFPVALAEHLGYQRRTARAHHKADAAQHHNEGHDKIDGGKRRFSGKIRYKKAVHHPINRGEHHHYDRRQCEPKQLCIGKMIG